jgi:hypothetical protein
MRRIVADKDKVGEFVMTRMPYPVQWTNYAAIGLERNNRLVAGVLFESMTARDVNMHCAIDDPYALNFAYVFTVFDYPFNTCNLARVTGLVPSKNTKALAFDIDHLGFKVEGIVREVLPDGDDVVVLGLLRRECKWLNGRQRVKR